MFHITAYDTLYRIRLTSSMYYDPKLVTTTKKQIQNMQLKLIHVILTSKYNMCICLVLKYKPLKIQKHTHAQKHAWYVSITFQKNWPWKRWSIYGVRLLIIAWFRFLYQIFGIPLNDNDWSFFMKGPA